MINITSNQKTRSGYQKYSTFAQKCEPPVVNANPKKSVHSTNQANKVAAVASRTSISGGLNSGALSGNGIKEPTRTHVRLIQAQLLSATKRPAAPAGAAAATLPIAAAPPSTSTAATTTPTTAAVATTTTTAAATTVSGGTNPVRAANQQFFLLPAFQDKNFLKEQCALAHAQVAPTTTTQQRSAKGNASQQQQQQHTDDRRNNNHSTASSVNGRMVVRSAAATNGVRRGGNAGAAGNGCENGAGTTNGTGAGGSREMVHKVEIAFNAPQLPSKTGKGSYAYGTTGAASAGNATRLSGNHVQRSFEHRTIPTSSLKVANAADNLENGITNKANNNGSVNGVGGGGDGSANGIANASKPQLQNGTGGNNNMQLPCRRDLFEQDNDDIKYIDSDEVNAPTVAQRKQAFCEQRCCPSSSTTAAKGRARPKSTIICSSGGAAGAGGNQQFVFEKVNNYKYANGGDNAAGFEGGPVTAAAPTTTGIDSKSIRASIDRFNSYSEQKRLPLTAVTLRPHSRGSSGSISNLQNQRHSTDLDNCNVRLPNSGGGGGGSLTRTPYRTALNATAAAASAHKVLTSTTTAATISNLHGAVVSSSHGRLAPSPLSGNNNTNSLPTKAATAAANLAAACRKNHDSVLIRGFDRASSLLSKESTTVNASSPTLPTSAPTVQHKATASAPLIASHSRLIQEGLAGTHTAAAAAASSAASTATANGAGLNGSVSAAAAEDCAARTTSIRSIPPSSPSSSRYWDRDSSRTSTLSSTSSAAAYNHLEETSKSSSANSDDKDGLCGLRNIGNTCFMNSIIQCLSHTTELTKFLRSHNGMRSSSSSSSSSTRDQQILQEFAKLIREMWTSNMHSVMPSDLKRAFSSKHSMYSGYNQQDAQEFLRFFLDSLHSALNTGVKGEPLKIDDNLSDDKKAELTWGWYARHENSLIRDLFVGQLKSTLKCTICGNTSVTFDPFWDLSVPLPSSSRCKLDACLDLFIREEVLDGDEMPTCSRCQTRRKCTKSFTIQRFPKYLVIHLKRFSETRWSKLSNIVEFPTGEREFNMGSYGSNPNMSTYYSLYAISNHMGSTAGGHYVALCKHPISKKWHEFNDNIVSDALSEHHLISSSAYILFYERV